MIEAGAAVWRGRAAQALPGIEADVMVVAAGRDEGCLTSVSLRQLKSKHTAVERQRSVEIDHLQSMRAPGCIERGVRPGSMEGSSGAT